MTRIPLILIATAALLVSAACGGDDATPASTPTTAASTPAAGTPAGEPTPDPTDEALARSLAGLAPLTLPSGDAPPGYEQRTSQPVARREAAVANIAIKPLATFLNLSDLQGAWVSFFVRTQPETSLSSRVYAFETPASATRFVETIANIQLTDYPAAIAVERVQADDIGDIAQMMRYRVPGSRTLEYTWAQGRYAGQVVLRYAGDIESTDDVGFILALARKQAELITTRAPQ
jgi:hypothetical protein